MGFFHDQNNALTVTEHEISSPLLAEAFTGFHVVHLSDLHGKLFGDDQRVLDGAVRELSPDLIAITGDIIDSTRYGGEAAIRLVQALAPIAPVYYVNGNHEWRSGRFPVLEQQLIQAGARVMRNEHEAIHRGGSQFMLLGIDDPFPHKERRAEAAAADEEIRMALQGIDASKAFTLLLSHRPELIDVYARNRIGLTLSGHAHGGQFRLPLIGGLFAPHQGFFPKFTEGLHTKEGCSLIVSRGLGNSGFPLRLFNRPEIVSIRLRAGRS